MVNRMVVALAVVVALTAGVAGAQTRHTYVGAHNLIGLAAVTDWTTTVDLDTRTLTVSGIVQNRSNVSLANVKVGVSDEDIVETDVVPSTLAPGQFGTFVAQLYTGTNLTASVYVMADLVPVARFVPWTER